MILKPELIIPLATVKSADEALRLAGTRFVDEGFAHASFVDALIEREHHFPTGLPSHTCAVALPHCDVRHIKQPAVGVVTLTEPVEFRMMGDPEQTLDVSILFVLGMKDPHAQPQLLSEIINIIQNDDLLMSVLRAHDSHEIVSVLNHSLA